MAASARQPEVPVRAPSSGQPEAAPWPDREAANTYLRYLLHVGLPVGASVVLHLAIILFAAHYAVRVLRPQSPNVTEWEGGVVDAGDLAEAFQWSDAAPLETPPDAPPERALDTPPALPPPADADLRALADRSPGALGSAGESGGLGLGDGGLSVLGTGTGAAEAGAGGFGAGFGAGAHGGQVGLWDLRVRAQRVAYVVDFSGSIIVAVDDLKRELKRSIGRLRPSQSFNVILFYSTGGGQDEKIRTESFRPKLEPADDAVRREFFTWLDRKAPMGVTEPLTAMKRALALEPDVVFFFSDGYFDDRLVGEIERANRGARTRIYGLVFDEILLQDTSGLPRETEGARRMKRIAESNGGKVKIVTGKDLARR